LKTKILIPRDDNYLRHTKLKGTTMKGTTANGTTMKGIAVPAAILACMFSILIKQTATAQDNVPHPDPTFQGKVGTTFRDSQADPKLFLPRSAPKGAPNILLVLIDDAGFGASSTFGGPCQTPGLTKLAQNGLRYNRFHTTAVCSPTRAALLTGHNHHSSGTGIIMECCTGFPGYTGIIPQSTASIGQILQDHGYTTAWIRKNHNVVGTQASMVGPHSRWPNQLGFDYFYGFLCGEMNQWYPTIYENQNPVQAWGTPEEGYNLGIDQTDKAIAWMRYQNSIAPDRPFFLYYAPGATHSPHHPPKEYAEKYKRKFAHGWDRQREITFAEVDYTHTINSPVEVWQAQHDSGQVGALEIINQNNIKTILHLS
jgi:arylsulfatase